VAELRAGRRIPVTLDAGQVAVVIGACGRLRDRFLLTLLAEAALRIGEACTLP
jgi:integrase/recombinase XerD